MPLAEGAKFAGYTILRLLGSGGMGEVYVAQHPRLPKRDAIKVLPKEVSADPDYRERFLREADLAAGLWHANIVGVHDRGEHEGQLWIAMDFIDGTDAAKLLEDRYPAGMPPELVAQTVDAVAQALDYAHKRGMLHRDVKPANILLTREDDDGDQRVLLADFGIARNVDDISGLTTTNMTVGTVAYCAPEQLMGEHLDGRADQYALAATAHHLLTGSQLFPSVNPAVVISRHLNSAPPALADTRAELAYLDPALTIALAKEPNSRFAHCRDFARALKGETIAPAAGPSSTVPTRPAPATRPASRIATGEPPQQTSAPTDEPRVDSGYCRHNADPPCRDHTYLAPLVISGRVDGRTEHNQPLPDRLPSDDDRFSTHCPASCNPTADAQFDECDHLNQRPQRRAWGTMHRSRQDRQRRCEPRTCVPREVHPVLRLVLADRTPTLGVNARNTSCEGETAWSSSRTPDGYLISCEPADMNFAASIAGPGSLWKRPSNV